MIASRGKVRRVPHARARARNDLRSASANHGGRVSETDIFLSYARQDRGTARIFADCLREEGFGVWWDASLHSGETFDEVIERHLRDAKAVIVLWSKASVASRWVRAEATLADRRNKLAPAIIEPCDRPIIFELTHAAELSDWTGDTSDARWRAFVQDVRRLVEAHRHDKQPSAEHAPARAHEKPLHAPAREHSDEHLAHAEVHCLEVEGGELPDQLIVVSASSLKVGRSAPADIVLSHKSVSREHCVIGLANDELLVTDLNSTNGTYIDGVRISRATILPVGSLLQLGQVALRHSVHNRSEGERRSRISGSAALQAQPVAAST